MEFLDLEESTNLGGHRATVNDLKHLQVAHDTFQQVLVDTIGKVGTNGRLLAGFEPTISGGNISYSAGWLFAKGHIWEIEPLAPTAVIAGGIAYLVFKFDNTYPPVQYQSAGFFQVHRRRYCEVEYLGGSSTPLGTQGVDYVAIYDSDSNQPAWRNYDTAGIVGNLIYSGITTGLSNSQESNFSYKIDGKTLHLNVSLSLAAPSPPLFEIKFPTEVVLKDKPHPALFAVDTHTGGVLCLVKFLPDNGTDPWRIQFDRTHTNTQEQTISFTATLELA